MPAFLEGPEAIVVVVVLLLVFGANRVPKLARQLGQAQRELKKGLHEGFEGGAAERTDPAPTALDAAGPDAARPDAAGPPGAGQAPAGGPGLPPPLPPPAP